MGVIDSPSWGSVFIQTIAANAVFIVRKINDPLLVPTDDITQAPPQAGRGGGLCIQERHSRAGELPLGSCPLWYVAEREGVMSVLGA